MKNIKDVADKDLEVAVGLHLINAPGRLMKKGKITAAPQASVQAADNAQGNS